MDDVTARRHRINPDFEINISATGVKLPDGRVSWRLHKSNCTATDGTKLTAIWWAQLFTDWAKTFLRKGLQK